jgi:hypothetical protein
MWGMILMQGLLGFALKPSARYLRFVWGYLGCRGWLEGRVWRLGFGRRDLFNWGFRRGGWFHGQFFWGNWDQRRKFQD